MKKKSQDKPTTDVVKVTPTLPVETGFAEVVTLIRDARHRAAQAVNKELIDLYWRVGEYLHFKIQADGWSKGTVVQLAAYIAQREPGSRGFSPQNLWRMRQFFDTYRAEPKLSPLVRVLPWTHNLLIMSRAKRPEEREFYLRLCRRERWGKRELERQLAGALYERTVLSPLKVSPAVRESYPDAVTFFKDTYLLDFLHISDDHSEDDLHRALIHNLGRFLTELGCDFCFIGSEYLIQVGGRDFALDLLFFHRSLNCLVAIELKVDQFHPEHLGKLNFYLEALDRDIRKPHENPSVGILLCATKDNEVVEYALSRSLSPALIAEYRTQLPDKKLLQAKLHEFYALNAPEINAVEFADSSPRKAKGKKT